MVNVREEESLHVRNLLIYYFLQGVGLALFFTVANSLFLSSFLAVDLPYAYIGAAIVMLVAGKMYDFIEHRFSMYSRAFLLIIMALSMLAFYIGTQSLVATWLPFVFFIWYRVIYNICDLEFWGLSSQVFDTRQAKRLFGVISAGEVPAKLIGYFSVALLVPLVGLPGLLVISSIAFFFAFFVLRRLLRHQHADIAHNRPGDDHTGHGKRGSKKVDTLFGFFKSNFIWILCLLYMVGAVTLTVVDFSFLTEVEEKFHSATELAWFFGITYGIGNTVIFIFKLFFSSRVIARLGIKASLIFLPLFILIIATVVAITGAASDMEYPLMIFFVILVIGGDLFKAILYEPLFLTLVQPLPSHLRSKAHLIIKGFVDPLGLGLTGIALYFGLRYTRHVELYKMDIVLLVLASIWIILVVLTYGKFLATLKSAITKRTIGTKELNVYDSISQKIIKEKLESNFPEEVIYAYELLSKNDLPFFTASLPKLLTHPMAEVRGYGLKQIAGITSFAGTDILLKMAQSDPAMWIREQAIEQYCYRYDEESVEHYQEFLDSTELTQVHAAIKGLMGSGNLEAILTAGQKLSSLLVSNNRKNHVTVATLIGEMKFKNYYKPLVKFFESDDIRVRKVAAEAAGKLKNARLIVPLFEMLKERKLRKVVTRSLSNYGETIISYIQDNPILLERFPIEIVDICELSGTERSVSLLYNDVLPKAEGEVLDRVLDALFKMDLGGLKPEMAVIDAKINAQTEFLLVCASAYERIIPPAKILNNALDEEIKNVKLRLLLLLSLIYDKATVGNIISAIHKKGKNENANSLEMLDNLLDASHKQKLVPLLEHASVATIKNHLSKYHNVHIDGDISDLVLLKRKHAFLQWTQACVLYVNLVELSDELLKGYRNHQEKMIREMVMLALSRKPFALIFNDDSNIDSMENAQLPADSLLEIEKILVLKSVPMFAETPENVLSGIAEIMREQRADRGEVIFKEGELGDCLYIIYDGEVSIHNGNQQLAKLGSREIFGELAMLDPEPRSATATASQDTLLFRMDKEDFDDLVDTRPEIAHGMLNILAKRIRNQNKLIRDTKGK